MSATRRRSLIRFAAGRLEANDMGLLGLDRTKRLARAFSASRHGELVERRKRDAQRHLALIDAELQGQPAPELRDGFVLDTSRSLPHLDRLLADMDEVIEEFGLTPVPDHGRPFLRDILPADGPERYPSILDFATSAPVVAAVARHAGWLVPMSGSLPPGVRLMESTTRYDPTPDGPWRSSQLWHIDYHSTPTIYVIVAVRDIGPDDGPLYYVGAEASQRVARAVNYGSRRTPYRLTDEVVEELLAPEEIHRLSCPAGTVLFIDSSRCLHFGSRRPASPRYHLQYSYISPVRNDFGDILREHLEYPLGEDDPPLRRLVLDRTAVA